MSERQPGFLWDDERRYIDAYRSAKVVEHDDLDLSWDEWHDQRVSEAVDNPRQVKSRIKNDATDISNLMNALTTFNDDLSAIQWFYTQILDQPEGRYEFLEYQLPTLEREIRKLRERLEQWEEWADQQTEFSDQVREEIAVIHEPLYEGLELVQQVQREGPSSELRDEYRKARKRADDADPQFVHELEERSTRRKTLAVLLDPENEALRELFEWIASHSGQKLPGNKIKGNSWQWWASTKLKNEHGLIKEASWGFELTQRGGAVRGAIRRLEETDVLDPFGHPADTEWTLHLLRFFHAADEWDDV